MGIYPIMVFHARIVRFRSSQKGQPPTELFTDGKTGHYKEEKRIDGEGFQECLQKAFYAFKSSLSICNDASEITKQLDSFPEAFKEFHPNKGIETCATDISLAA